MKVFCYGLKGAEKFFAICYDEIGSMKTKEECARGICGEEDIWKKRINWPSGKGMGANCI